ncbi:hypothetical protein HK100_002342 [Physocladia obscura]|uniref:Methyltransferase FkbM domain-containing protein n=1 Tax=Physocladia obscura TaxID=109957 RepID=A0AAD5SY65_9FUNG|nr:hypothetical protein HK100_002342 [Physocladia obscura]
MAKKLPGVFLTLVLVLGLSIVVLMGLRIVDVDGEVEGNAKRLDGGGVGVSISQCRLDHESVLVALDSSSTSIQKTLRLFVYPVTVDPYHTLAIFKNADHPDKFLEAAVRTAMLKDLRKHSEPNKASRIKSQANITPPAVLDIGAYTGYHSVFLALEGYSIHSFEPFKPSFNLAVCSVFANNLASKVHLFNFGFGLLDENRCILQKPSNPGQNVIDATPVSECPPDSIVEVKRLDSYLITNNIKPYLIKIDTVGFEFNTLITAKDYFAEFPPTHFYTEFSPDDLALQGVDAKEYLNFFYDLGYLIEETLVPGFLVVKGSREYKDILNTRVHLHAYRV